MTSGSINLEEIGHRGWTTARVLDGDGIRRALEMIDELDLSHDEPFFASPAHAWGPIAAEVDRRLRQIVVPSVRNLLPAFQVFLAGVTIKGGRDKDGVPFHQDWTYTDERRSRAIFAWCPLVDTNLSNGGLAVIEGSHLWSNRIRPSRTTEPSIHFQEELRARSRQVESPAGQAVVFDPGVFHGSGPNLTDATRPAFTIGMVATGEPLVHFHQPDGEKLEGFAVDEQFFTTNPYRSRPEGYPPVAPYDRSDSVEDLRSILDVAGAEG